MSSHPADRSGSTVVVLLLRGVRSAVLWAGDSRVYRWRGGTPRAVDPGSQPGGDLAGPAPRNRA